MAALKKVNSCFIIFRLTSLLEESSEPEEEYTSSSFVHHELVLQWREHVDLERQMNFLSYRWREGWVCVHPLRPSHISRVFMVEVKFDLVYTRLKVLKSDLFYCSTERGGFIGCNGLSCLLTVTFDLVEKKSLSTSTAGIFLIYLIHC